MVHLDMLFKVIALIVRQAEVSAVLRRRYTYDFCKGRNEMSGIGIDSAHEEFSADKYYQSSLPSQKVPQFPYFSLSRKIKE